jgi:hypothetical protein
MAQPPTPLPLGLHIAAIFQLFRCGEDGQSRVTENPYAWQFGPTEPLTHIIDIEQVTSDDSFGVQLADLAAGLMNRVAVARVYSRRLAIQQRQVVTAWRPSFAPLGSHFFMASNATLRRVARTLFFE